MIKRKAKKNKFHAKKVVIDGMTFDSQIEGRFYKYLKDQQAKGMIDHFERQVVYPLLSTIRLDGHTMSKVNYKADFVVYGRPDSEGKIIDIKGSKNIITPVFRLKRRLVALKYGKVVHTIIYKGKKKGWTELP